MIVVEEDRRGDLSSSWPPPDNRPKCRLQEYSRLVKVRRVSRDNTKLFFPIKPVTNLSNNNNIKQSERSHLHPQNKKPSNTASNKRRIRTSRSHRSILVVLAAVALTAISTLSTLQSAAAFESLRLSPSTSSSISSGESLQETAPLSLEKSDPLSTGSSSSSLASSTENQVQKDATTLQQQQQQQQSEAQPGERQVIEIYGKQSVDHDLIQAVASGRQSIEHVIPLDRVPEELATADNERRGAQQVSNELDISMVQSAAKKRPPIYMSAPKQIEALNEIQPGHFESPAAGESGESDKRSLVIETEKSFGQMKKPSSDLHTAADGYYHKKKQPKKKKKKVKIIVVKKKKKKKKKKHYKKKRHSYKKKKVKKVKKVKKMKKPKKVKVVMMKKPSYHHHHHHNVVGGGGGGGGHYHHDHYGDHSGYYEFREVPKKGAWKYGYKRGNKKHTIERKEHGHKSHFKTEVKWKDKKGKGHHVFDYNHHDKKKKHHGGHYAAAASTNNQQQNQASSVNATIMPPPPTQVNTIPDSSGPAQAIEAKLTTSNRN